MKVLRINGSPKEHGNTFQALSELAKTLNTDGIETEIVSIGKLHKIEAMRISVCLCHLLQGACSVCSQGKERAFSDVVHEDVYNTISFYMCNHNTAKKNGVL